MHRAVKDKRQCFYPCGCKRRAESPGSTASIDSNKASEMNVDLSKRLAFEPKPKYTTESMISGMAPVLLLGQYFSFLGVSDAACRHGKSPVFRWRSFRMFISLGVSFLLAMQAILIGTNTLSGKLTLNAIHSVTFFLSSFLTSCLFMRLASRWASLCAAFESMEKQISFYGDSRGLKRKMKIISAAVLLAALAERIIGEFKFAVRINMLYDSEFGTLDWFERYYSTKFDYMLAHVPFSPLAIFVTQAIHIMSVFIFSYNDTLIMLICVAISSRFRILNDSLIKTAHKDKHWKIWRHSRETYNALCTLVRTVDSTLGCQVFISFMNNFVFICLQLLRTFSQHDGTGYEKIHSTFSFGLILGRSIALCLFAASIYDESRAIKRVLYSVSSRSYCVEVERFIEQVTFDEVALTGCGYFSLTRSFLLTVFGTITTYEVVLVQLNESHAQK